MNVSIKRILVAVDGSEASFKAAKYAVNLAKIAGAEIVPVNILEDVKQGGVIGLQAKYGNVSIVEAFKKTRKKAAEEWLRKIELAANKVDVKAKGAILDSKGKNDKKLIVEYARKNNIDIIVIGSKGHSRFKGLWVGGFTNSVLHQSTIPILVVP